MTDRIAKGLALTVWAALLPAYFHHFAPLACWLTAWIVLIVTNPRIRNV